MAALLCGSALHAAAQAVDGGADRGGVVREVVVDTHTRGLATQLQAPASISPWYITRG